MLKSALSVLLLAAFSISTAQAADTIGFKEIELPDASGGRPLLVSIWYPTIDVGPAAPVGENSVFYGVPAIQDAKPVDDAYPLVVLSHGYGGSWRNLNWLAGELVHQEYFVATPDHPGTTTFDKSPAQAAKLWGRPRDLSRVIDALAGDPSLVGLIEPAHIAAIGVLSEDGWSPLLAARASARSSSCRTARCNRTHARAVSPSNWVLHCRVMISF